MTTFTVTTECWTHRTFRSRHEAEEGKETHEALCEECRTEDVRIEATPDPSDESTIETAVEEDGEGSGSTPAATIDLPEGIHDSVRTDPLDVVPSYMITEVDGRPTINKRGYAVIAHHFDIVVRAEPITTAGETDHEYAEFAATAWKRENGPESGYTGHATARASEDRRGIEHNLNEMAETRAMKRAVAWASGVGLLAWEELAGYVDAE